MAHQTDAGGYRDGPEPQGYTPKVGDRVRVTLVREGKVLSVNDDIRRRFWFKDDRYDAAPETPYPTTPMDGVTYEKLQDPEPEWVNGDVVEVRFTGPGLGYPMGPRKAARVDGRWLFTDTGDKAGPHLIGNHWPDVKILYKADAA